MELDSASSVLRNSGVLYIPIVEPDAAPSALSLCAMYILVCGVAAQQIFAELVERRLSKSLLSLWELDLA